MASRRAAEDFFHISTANSPGVRAPVKYCMRTPSIPPAPVPDEIHLPDGRRYSTQALLDQVTRSVNIDARTGVMRSYHAPKYTQEQRQDLATQPVEWIADRYRVSTATARRMQYNSRIALGMNRKTRT